MEIEDKDFSNNCEESHIACSAVNNLILDYYKKFGRKRDLEQFFSLSTAQSEVRDPCSLFWRRMKSQDESSDSGGRKSESSTELCRISIKCSIPEPSSSEVEQSRVKSDSESPPIISEEIISEPTRNSDNESVKSDDLQSQKSIDCTLDTSTNKPHSPTSSITNQRKLEWDSLADVGYANESDRKNSASSLSTLERMALQQQYSFNDTKKSHMDPPTAQSTPLEPNEAKPKNKKGAVKKTTKIHQNDIDSVELSIPQNPDNKPQPINLNLTKHISFNVDRNGSVLIENVTKNLSLSPEKVSVKSEVTQQIKVDKEIQTTLNKSKDKSCSPVEKINHKEIQTTLNRSKDKFCSSIENLKHEPQVKKYPVISLNSLKKKAKKKKVRRIKKQQSKMRLIADKENIPLEKSGDQLSEAESFEYMPGHMYNQNHMKYNQRKNNVADNKSSLESSGLTTDSNKTKKYSFTKDLEKSIDMLKSAFDQKYEDANLRKNLIKDIVQRLVESKYNSDKGSTELLSEFSFKSKRLGLGDNNYTTTSTSDTNNTANEESKPKKSILRMDKFNINPIASTSQSVPNIPIFTNNDKPIESNILKSIDLSNTDSDISNKKKAFSDLGADKTSSEELYKKYLEALKREQVYKRHLKDKEMFLKHKLVSSDVANNAIRQVDTNAQNRIKDLMKDLIRNNYDDGSGDASKLEGGSNAYLNTEKYNSLRKQRSHSVFTLSSGNSENCCKNGPFANKHKNEAHSSKINTKVEKHYCCCPLHALHPKVGVTDSSVQVNIKSCRDHESPACNVRECIFQHTKILEAEPFKCEKCISPRNKTLNVSDSITDNFKYVCLCTDEGVMPQEMPEKFLIYKCSRLPSKTMKLEDIVTKAANNVSASSSNFTSPQQKISSFKSQDCDRKCLVIKDSTSSNIQTSKSSQTNLNLPIMLRPTMSQQSVSSSATECKENVIDTIGSQNIISRFIHEATRCVQTEISIDPKISDPSLSDLNIVNDENCVVLINEQYKKVTKPTSDKSINTQSDKTSVEVKSSESTLPKSNRNLQTEYEKCISTSAEEEFTILPKVDKEVQYLPDHIINNNSNTDKHCSNNFTIPIQGTNMTLKVSLGSEAKSASGDENKVSKKNTTFMSKGTVTIKPHVVENSTSLQEECSKAVQSSNTKFFEEFYRKPPKPKGPNREGRNTYRDNFDPQVENNEKSNVSTKSCYVNPCLTDCKYNTYPTEDRSHIQKPLLRSNTDPSKIDKACHVKFNRRTTADIGDQTGVVITPQNQTKAFSTKQQEKAASCCSEISSKSTETSYKTKVSSDTDKRFKSSCSEPDVKTKVHTFKDPMLDIIQDITKRYSKKDIEKSKRKKCFKEIITVLSYLLDTEESTDHDRNKASCSSACDNGYDPRETLPQKEMTANSIPAKILVDKAVQLSTKKSKLPKSCTESSDFPISTDFPSTSSDAATCKVLNKIKRECEKYHQKRCKCGGGKKCEGSSSTSVNCDQCRRFHHCSCRGHKCKGHRTKTVEKAKKKCVAYNLIIQASDSIVSEEINCGNNRRQLQNIIVKVPSKQKVENVPFKEMATKIERNMSHCSPRCDTRGHRSKSLPNDCEISSTDEIIRMAQDYTVREFLEKNRPDFVEKCTNRQDCLKLINKTRANERTSKRQLLSLQLDRQQTLNALSESDLKDFARALGNELRRNKVAPNFINERDMKKHSKKIYKSLPEVVQKKEEIKKENIKKTNLLMANIFKKNLQKKTLRGAINISNYSSVIKI